MSKNLKDPDLPRHSAPQPGATASLCTNSAGDVTVSFSDGSDDLTMNRRDFMRVSGVAAATAAMSSAACRRPVRHIVPYVDRPEEVRIGITNQYASICNACPSQCGTLVKTRAGRPFKLEGNPQHPISEGALCARGQASYLDLYDPDRLHAPLRPTSEDSADNLDWASVDAELAVKVGELRGGAGLRILTGTVGPSTKALIDTIVDELPNAAHYTYEPLADEAAARVSEAGYGRAHKPHYRFEKAKYVVSLGNDFLGTWNSPVENTRRFIANRNPDEDMSRLIAFEGSLSLTGVNADHRFRVRPDQMVYIALALTQAVISNHNPGGVSAGTVAGALQPFTPQAVAERLGGDITAELLQKIAAELARHAGESLVLAGGTTSATENGIGLEAAVTLLNAALRNDGATIERSATISPAGGLGELKALIAEIESGQVDTLIIAGTNPAYTAISVDFAAALQKVSFVVSTSTHLDETAAHASLVAPGVHYLEGWGDSNPRDGVFAIQQPTILPLFENRSFEDSLLTWFGTGPSVLASFLVAPEAPVMYQPGNARPYDPGPFYRFVRTHWEDNLYPLSNSLAGFDRFWNDILRAGVLETTPGKNTPRLNPRALTNMLPGGLPEATSVDLGSLGDKTIHLFPSVGLYDGRQANNGHLQELPDPISRHTWGSYAMVGYNTAEAANLEPGSILELEVNGETLSVPVIVMPGMHEDVIAIPLGYGRTAAGTVANDIGANAYKLVTDDGDLANYTGLSASIRNTGRVEKLSTIKGAGVIDVDRHRILATATLDEYRENKSVNIHEPVATHNLWEDHDFGDLKWGMAIDLTKCTGCAACVTACQEENNIPVVGRQGILEGREMHWLRIDRYYELPDEALAARTLFEDPMYAKNPQVSFGEYLDKPRVVFQPMLCQHCDRAPCETVCPVLATMQSNDGLNQMSYQACVGTRYCSNNCPYKVRRYNWFNYTENRSETFFARLYPELKDHARLNVEGPLRHAFNPDVTVRTRGVMEKCTFCVQRIRRAKWEIMKDGRRTFRDGEVVTACQQSCPADAISFGNRLDESHRVHQEHHTERAMKALDDLKTEPAIRYLTNVFNTDEELA